MAKRRRAKSEAERRLRELELQREKNRDTLKKVAMIITMIAIVGVAWWAFGGAGNEGPAPTEGLVVNAEGNLEIPTSDVSDDARFYNIDADGVEVRFFAVRGSDGKVRVAMDACDVCYDQKKGYRQEGNDMVCNNCGNRYGTDGIGTKNLKGGCWPSYVPINIQDDNVLIKASDLKAKRYMFD